MLTKFEEDIVAVALGAAAADDRLDGLDEDAAPELKAELVDPGVDNVGDIECAAGLIATGRTEAVGRAAVGLGMLTDLGANFTGPWSAAKPLEQAIRADKPKNSFEIDNLRECIKTPV